MYELTFAHEEFGFSEAYLALVWRDLYLQRHCRREIQILKKSQKLFQISMTRMLGNKRS